MCLSYLGGDIEAEQSQSIVMEEVCIPGDVLPSKEVALRQAVGDRLGVWV